MARCLGPAHYLAMPPWYEHPVEVAKIGKVGLRNPAVGACASVCTYRFSRTHAILPMTVLTSSSVEGNFIIGRSHAMNSTAMSCP